MEARQREAKSHEENLQLQVALQKRSSELRESGTEKTRHLLELKSERKVVASLKREIQAAREATELLLARRDKADTEVPR